MTRPRTWLVTADLKVRCVVILALNHDTEARTGYALGPAVAKKMAAGLISNADAVLGLRDGPVA